jgi:hypothetical protein
MLVIIIIMTTEKRQVKNAPLPESTALARLGAHPVTA